MPPNGSHNPTNREWRRRPRRSGRDFPHRESFRRRRREVWRDAAHVSDMIEAAKLVAVFVGGRTLEQYEHDPLLRSAVERQVEIIGEACRQISDETLARFPEIPWLQIIAQRHRLAHEYGDVNDRVIWEIATQRAPSLAQRLLEILHSMPRPKD